MNNRDIAKMGFAVLAAVMSYNFADTIVHAEETSVEPVKEESTVEDTDPILDVVEPTEETEEAKDTTVTVGGSDTSAKLTEGWSSDSM